jgi:hypothetical protein
MENGTQDGTNTTSRTRISQNAGSRGTHSILLIGFMVIVVVNVMIMTIRDVMMCILLNRYKLFGETCGLISQL